MYSIWICFDNQTLRRHYYNIQPNIQLMCLLHYIAYNIISWSTQMKYMVKENYYILLLTWNRHHSSSPEQHMLHRNTKQSLTHPWHYPRRSASMASTIMWYVRKPRSKNWEVNTNYKHEIVTIPLHLNNTCYIEIRNNL